MKVLKLLGTDLGDGRRTATCVGFNPIPPSSSPQELNVIMNAPIPKDVVLYDGQCNFCRSQINILRRLDSRQRLDFLSLHDPRVALSYPNLSFAQLMEEMWIVTTSGEQYGGAYAVRYLSRKLPILWPIAPLLHFPFSMPIWRFLYRQIAKYRYRIAGRDCDEGGTCSLHR